MSTQPWILFQKLDDGTKYDEPLERSENGVMPQGSIIILKPGKPKSRQEVISESQLAQ